MSQTVCHTYKVCHTGYLTWSSTVTEIEFNSEWKIKERERVNL